MKKLKACLTAAIFALLLSACSENTAQGETSRKTSETDNLNLQSEDISDTAEDSSAASETETKHSPVSSSDVFWVMPSDEQIHELFDSEDFCGIKYTADKTYAPVDHSEYENMMMADYVDGMLTEDGFEAYKDMMAGLNGEESDEELTFEEYEALLYQTFGIMEKPQKSDYAAMFSIECGYGYDDSEISEKEAGEAVLAYIARLLCSGDERFGAFTEMAENNEQPVMYISYYTEGDSFAQIYAYIYDDYYENGYIIDGEYISLSGGEVITVGGRPVDSKTKSLYISAYDETVGSMLDYIKSEEYECVIFDYDEETPVDVEELSEKLPDLEKIYLSNCVKVSDYSKFGSFEKLSELCLDVSGSSDLSALSELKTDKLCITGVEASADALAKAQIGEISAECTPNEGVLESIFRLPNVTELTINRYSGEEFSLDGIEKLTELKKLDVSAGSGAVLDLAPAAKLKNLEDLSIMAYKTKNLGTISEIRYLKKLMLHSMDEEDLSFLSYMPQLEELSLMYVNSSFCGSLDKLSSLQRLYLSDIDGYVSFSDIYKIQNLRSLHIMGGSFYAKGISGLDKLESLNLMLCDYSDLSELKKCSSLSSLIIYNCTTPDFNAKDIEGMTGLEDLRFNCSDISNYESLKTLTGLKKMNLFFCNLTNDEIEELKAALPDCEIMLDSDVD